MLEIGSKTFTVDGITIFADHADPNQFWYLPGPVQLARRPSDNRAAFTMIKYAGVTNDAVTGGGFLMVEVNLRLEPEVERRILARLSSLAPDRPRLAAVPFDEGTVECIALDLQGPGGTTAQVAADGSFQAVERILGATVPSLHGDNVAAFSLKLSQAGATILERVFADAGTPIGAVYSLKYTGLRPALDVEITADLKVVYNHFSAGLQGQIYFLRAGIDAGFEKLVQNGVIQIKVINYSTAADKLQQETWALNFFKENLLNDWFRPTLTPGQLAGGLAQAENLDAVQRRANQLRPPATPEPPRPSATEQPTPPPSSSTPTPADRGSGAPATTGVIPNLPVITDAVAQQVATAMPPASARPATTGNADGRQQARPTAANNPMDTAVVSFQLKFIRQEELKRLQFRYSRAEAVQRTYAPQGFFGLLAQDLTRESHFFEIDLHDPFFEEFTVSIETPFEKERIGLASAHVQLDYGNPDRPESHKHRDFVIGETSDEIEKWVVKNLPGYDEYTYQVQYHFAPDTGWYGAQFSYNLPPVTTADRTLLLHPFTHLGFLEVEITANRIDWSVVADIEAHLRYTAPDGWQRSDTFFFTEAARSAQQWKLRLSTPDAHAITYECIYRLRDGSRRTLGPLTTEATKIDMPNPFFPIRIEFIPLYEPGHLRLVFVDLDYEDAENDYVAQARLRLDGNSYDSAMTTLHIVDPTKRTFRYRFTLIGTDGSLTRGPFLETSETLIGVDPTIGVMNAGAEPSGRVGGEG